MGRLVLHRSLYEPEAVEAAAEAYRPVVRVDVKVGDADIVIEVAEDPRLPDLDDAFANHALFETIVRGRRPRASSAAGKP